MFLGTVKKTGTHTGLAWLAALAVFAWAWNQPLTTSQARSSTSSLVAKAERDFTDLKRKVSLQRYRHNYLKIMDSYRRIFETFPRSADAETALFRAGELYTLLYRWTSIKSDLNTAKDYYQRLIDSYPRSRLADDAQLAVALLYLDHYQDRAQAYREFEKVSRIAPKGDQTDSAERWMKKLAPNMRGENAPAASTTAAAAARSVSKAAVFLARAEKDFTNLRKKTSLQRYRHNYVKVMDRYRRVFERYPDSTEAETSLLRAGELYTLLYRWTSLKSDLNRSKHYYQRLIKSYPRSSLVDDAQMAIAFLYLNYYNDRTQAYREFRKVPQFAPRGDRRAESERWLKKLARHKPPDTPRVSRSRGPIPAVLSRVDAIRHWSNPEYTRVVIDLDQPTHFYSNLLKESSQEKKPPRLYLDLFNTMVESRYRQPIPVNDGILLTIRAGQFTPDTVRVVLDIDQLKTYRIFPMENPFRLVVDVTGGDALLRKTSAPAPAPAASSGKISLAQQLGLQIRRVVIDAGHGANDPGAIGVNNIREKDITLDLALRLRNRLSREGLDIVLTRDRDIYLPLEERTAIANTSRGDLFLSLHTNSSAGGKLRGVETYFLNLASSLRARETAARENSMALAKMSDLEHILKEIFNSKMDESSRLAESIQKNMVHGLRHKFKGVKNLGVKQAPFYVLIGAEMPSILAEVSFINHPVEGKRLASEQYRQLLVDSLAAGVMDYIQSVKIASANP